MKNYYQIFGIPLEASIKEITLFSMSRFKVKDTEGSTKDLSEEKLIFK